MIQRKRKGAAVDKRETEVSSRRAPQESRDTRLLGVKFNMYAPVAELADAYGSGPYFLTGVQVRFLSGAPKSTK